uniref:DUS-like FMN-binding domain-containing protein n=1 Tax=Ditylum brightwellii TaxID=49249 RepID=A0A6U3T1N1_9STRA|mmetsp:Transcript_3499/g.5422  ORF Transcript_3499/g.5422 Transcript_3499/m.5422 type:complete len:559 (+) Transcript_3499:182-1858(+)
MSTANNCEKEDPSSSSPMDEGNKIQYDDKKETPYTHAVNKDDEEENAKNITKPDASSIQERANALFLNAEILAPMVRASTTPLRTLALQYGADLVFTEEIIDRSITTCDRIVNKELGTVDYVRKLETFSPKVRKRMKSKDEIPVILRIDPKIECNKLIYQMGTGEADLALPAALMVQEDVDGIDINMGCPKKFSVSGGMGSALLSDVNRACKIIRTLRENLTIPVSAKIRLLKTNDDTIEFVLALVRAGANAITIHAREVGDESQKPAKWDRLVELVQALKKYDEIKKIPIILNGDLYTRKDMIQMKRKCGADGVMLARPALYNTSLFCKPSPPKNNTSSENEDCTKEDEEQYSYKSKLLKSKTSVVQDYINHAVRYQTNSKNVKYVVCEMMNNRRAPTKLTPFLTHNFQGGQTIDKVCKTRSLADLCHLWGVKEEDAMQVASSDKVEQPAGEHRYDDRYFLEYNGFQKERIQHLTTTEEEKKENNDNGGEESNHSSSQLSSLKESAISENTNILKQKEGTSDSIVPNGKRKNDDESDGQNQSLVAAAEDVTKRPKIQ